MTAIYNKANCLQGWVTLALAAIGLTAVDIAKADDELPFTVAQVLIQLNDTDGDLGFHARIDGDPWKRLTIENPDERKLLNVALRGQLRRQGLTEFSFESAEPTFEELAPEVFFKRFPEGPYEVEGKGVDGVEYESVSYLSHLIPAAPGGLKVSGDDAPEDCDGDIPTATAPIVISWAAVVSSHPELGRSGNIEVDSYEVAIEGETIDYTVDVEGDVVSIELASGAIPSGEEIKFQVLVRESEGNETSAESCFIAP